MEECYIYFDDIYNIFYYKNNVFTMMNIIFINMMVTDIINSIMIVFLVIQYFI
jgi:hypothetical protein